MADTQLRDWSTTAINLPDHADNVIHTDEGARAAGFDRALVAGTTVYAYLTHVPAASWGLAWLGGGGGELRLRRPVFDGDRVDCVVSTPVDGHGDGEAAPSTVTAQVAGDARASLELWSQVQAPAMRQGEPLKPMDLVLGEAEADYGVRCGDDLALYLEQSITHPVVWLNLANRVFIENLVTGPWIHVRSKIFHEGVAPGGANIHIDSVLVNRFDSRAGERALVDMRIFANGEPVATIEHEAIIILP